MTSDFRALCAELVEALHNAIRVIYHEDGTQHISTAEPVLQRARAQLAQPEGEELTDEELEVIASQFCAFYAFCPAHMSSPDEWWCSRSDLTTFARAAIAADRARRPKPQPPADGEVAELVAWLRTISKHLRIDQLGDEADQTDRAAELLQCQQTQPEPVSERPWEREGWCDAEGRCWMGDPGGGGFIPSWRLCRPEDAPNMKVSLPFHALPLPTTEEAGK